MNKVTIRPAFASDAAELAILDAIASSGLAPWLWSGGVREGVAATDMEHGRNLMADETLKFGYKAADVAEFEGTVCGMAISYQVDMPAEPPSLNEETEVVLSPIYELLQTIHASWYMDGLAVYQQHQGKGIGRKLILHVFEKAKAAQLNTLSLITDDHNLVARRLYESLGFSVVDQRPYVPFNKNSTSKNWLLMSAQLH